MILNQSWRSSVILRHCVFKQLVPVLKSSTFFSMIRRKPILLQKTEYKLLYDFPLIVVPATLIRSGYTCILLSVASSPFIYYYFGSVTPCLMVLGAACIHFIIMGLGFSKIFGNMVGKIYVNKEGEVENVMICSMDNFGGRIDRIHKVDDLINCEFPTKFHGSMGIIQISAENSIHYIVNLRSCKIQDPSIWENLFGKIPLSKMIRSSKIVVTKKID